MNEDKDIKELNEEVIVPTEAEVSDSVSEEVVSEEVVAPVSPEEAKPFLRRNNRDNKKGRGKRFARREERVKPEFDQKIISMRRVTRVVAGGRRMSFSVAVVAGNKRGKVGVGTGKAVDTALAIDKAFRDAKKNMINILLTKSNSIPHDVRAKYSASVVMLSPSRGRGLVAGGSVRNVLELAGITDISGKLLSRSKNGINNARATIEALGKLRVRKNK